jgi:hypothetical protein
MAELVQFTHTGGSGLFKHMEGAEEFGPGECNRAFSACVRARSSPRADSGSGKIRGRAGEAGAKARHFFYRLRPD